MRILIDIGHPANFLLVKNFYNDAKNIGHEVFITIRDKEVTKRLLDISHVEYFDMGVPKKKLFKIFGIFIFSFKLWKISRQIKPDLYFSHSSIYCSLVSLITKIPHLSFHANDSLSNWHNFLLKIGTDIFVTPMSVKPVFYPKQIYYSGNHELAYLHPQNFTPDLDIISSYGLVRKKYVLVRFVSWDAIDDLGNAGLTNSQKIEMVDAIRKEYEVIVSSESELIPELRKYAKEIPVNKFQDFIANAALVFGESGSVASEAAVLGVPSIYYNTKQIGFLEELSNFGLCFLPRNYIELQKIIFELINEKKIDEKYQFLRRKYLEHVINVHSFMLWFVLNYPSSKLLCKQDPNYYKNFSE